MSEQDRYHRTKGSAWHTRSLLLQSEIAWLILLSVLDVFLTWFLLARGPQFIESNPLAAWVFSRYNIKGLVAYKFILIAGVVVIAEVVEYAKVGRGRLVLRIGILAAAAVVIYSVMLNLRHPF